MNTYQIVLACLCCGMEYRLFSVQAVTEFEARLAAFARRPDVRFDELVAYKVEAPALAPRRESPVEQFL